MAFIRPYPFRSQRMGNPRYGAGLRSNASGSNTAPHSGHLGPGILSTRYPHCPHPRPTGRTSSILLQVAANKTTESGTVTDPVQKQPSMLLMRPNGSLGWRYRLIPRAPRPMINADNTGAPNSTTALYLARSYFRNADALVASRVAHVRTTTISAQILGRPGFAMATRRSPAHETTAASTTEETPIPIASSAR